MKLLEIFGERIKKNEPLNRHTTYRLGGPADFYFEAKSPEEAAAALGAAKEGGLPAFALGGGSNVLVSDAGFRGLVIAYAARKTEIRGSRLAADAGAILFAAVRSSADAGLAGLEWAAGIPGTVGGAIRGNAGAYGGEIKDVLESVDALNFETGERRNFAGDECGFGYRESRFKRERWFLLGATFALSPGDKAELLAKIKETVVLRVSKQPLEFGSAGSVFKSLVIADGVPASIKGDVPQKYVDFGRIPAAWLIERAGLKGRRIGEAMISEKHANYFVNTGKASAAEVRELIAYAKMEIRKAFGIELVEEIEYVGF